jgi:hypothetical protein
MPCRIVECEKAKKAVGRYVEFQWGPIYEVFFDDLKKEFGRDKKIKKFVEDHKQLFEDFYHFFEKDGVDPITVTIHMIYGCIKNFEIVTFTCCDRINCLMQTSKYKGMIDKIKEKDNLFIMAAGVIIDG